MASDLTSDTFLASKKISDEIKADLAVHPEKYTMLTGDRPTGRLHMGHYFGTIRERVALQNAGVTTRIIIADYQVITDRDTTANIADNVHNMVIDYLACGIDPEKTIIFTHSAVPALNQLMLPFLSLVTESELMRNPTVKAEQEASGHALTGLLLSYPVHQACDILFCKGNVVPVGKDQLPHIEQTRQIARRFNERYGQVFPEPHGLLTDAVEIPGLDGRKMSKSYGNAIALSATEEETAKLIKKSQDRLRAHDHLRQGEPPRRVGPADHGGAHHRPHRTGHRGGDRQRRRRRPQALRDRVGERVSGPHPRASPRTGRPAGDGARDPA